MALVIEDGTGKPDAESYATVDELRAYAAKRGASVSADDGACEVLLIKANDYLQAQEPRYKGHRVSGNQALAWPRSGVWINGYPMASDEIPAQLKQAQMQLALDSQTLDLMPTQLPSAQGPVTYQKVDVIEREFAEPTVQRTTPYFAKADALLAPLVTAGAGQIKVVRA